MINMPVVSIIIPTYNRAHYIHKTIQSALAQTFQEFEIMIVDNGSTDETAKVVKSFPDSRIRYFYQENSGSPVSPRNNGIKKATGKYIAFLDSDDLWLPGKLDKQVHLLENNPTLSMVYSDAYIINEEGDIINKAFSLHRQFDGRVFKKLLRTNFIPNLTAVIKRDIVLDYGGLDEQYKICHDLDLYLKVADDHAIACIDEPLAKLRLHKDSMTADRSLTRQEFRSIITKWRHSKTTGISDLYYRKILSFFFCMEAFDLLNANDNLKARKRFKEAFRHFPLNPLYGLFYLTSICNERLLIKIFNKLYENRLHNKKIAGIMRF